MADNVNPSCYQSSTADDRIAWSWMSVLRQVIVHNLWFPLISDGKNTMGLSVKPLIWFMLSALIRWISMSIANKAKYRNQDFKLSALMEKRHRRGKKNDNGRFASLYDWQNGSIKPIVLYMRYNLFWCNLCVQCHEWWTGDTRWPNDSWSSAAGTDDYRCYPGECRLPVSLETGFPSVLPMLCRLMGLCFLLRFHFSKPQCSTWMMGKDSCVSTHNHQEEPPWCTMPSNWRIKVGPPWCAMPSNWQIKLFLFICV